jgi:hypothetical protein
MDPLQQLKSELDRSVSDLSAAQILERPSANPDRWNIYQIVQHLLLTYSSTSASIQGRLEKGNPTRSTASLSQLAARLIVLQLGFFPGGRPAPSLVTPSAIPPDPAVDGRQLASAAAAALDSMDGVLNYAQSRFGAVPCLSHFALGPLSITQWRRFHLLHGRHHIRQIFAIRRAYGF